MTLSERKIVVNIVLWMLQVSPHIKCVEEPENKVNMQQTRLYIEHH